MAVPNGEERLLTVYADVHSYFNTPSPRPLDHRFDKGSYLYLYGDKCGNGGRIEIANHVGKPEQDAFSGSEHAALQHPRMLSLTEIAYQRLIYPRFASLPSIQPCVL